MGLDNIPGWSDSAERAWYEPPEPWGSCGEEKEEEEYITVKKLIKIIEERNRKNETLRNK